MATMSLLSTSTSSSTFTFRNPKAHSFSSSRPLQLPVNGGVRRTRLHKVVALAMEDGQNASGQTQLGGFSISNLPDWAKFLLGGLAWLTVPAFRRLQKIGDAVEKVDSIVEKVEEYADKVEKIAEEISDELPEGKLKDFVDKVEDASEAISDRADKLDEVLDKVTDILDDIEEDRQESLEREKEKKKEA